MTNGAIQLFGGVPARNLDPMLLVKSQVPGSTGFIMVAYEHSASETSAGCTRFFDLYFFRGARVFECARLNQDLRFTVGLATALETFAEYREGGGTTVQLYKADEDVLRRLRSTFYYEPCLKVQIDALTRRQIALLLAASRCRRGILECNAFYGPQPLIHLVEVESAEQVSAFRPSLRTGRLLLYDIEKNREIIRERHGACLEGGLPEAGGIPEESPVRGTHAAVSDTPGGHIELAVEEPPAAPKAVSKAGRRPPPAATERRSELGAIFGRLWRDFSRQLLELHGSQAREMIARAEEKARVALRSGQMTEEAAPAVLAMIEDAVSGASFLRRARVRAAAAGLVSEFYNANYPLLEAHHLIEAVEQTYYRLKK